MNPFFKHMRRLRRDDDGAAFVEFALILPLILVMFAITIEGSRLFWAYEAATAGVRDASRYLGRSAQTDICNTGDDLSSWTGILTDIVRDTSNGASLFPSSITVNSVSVSVECFTGDFRLNNTPVVTVSAQMQITYPFQGIFEWVGVTMTDTTTTITDSSRVFGA